VLADLRPLNLLASEKPYRLRVPRSGRSEAIVEPMLTDQWFLAMESLGKAAPAAVKTASFTHITPPTAYSVPLSESVA